MRNVGEQDISWITSAGVKFMRRAAKNTWQDLKTNEDILSELIVYPVVKKIQNCRNKWLQHVRRMDRDRQTATLGHEIKTMLETKPRTTLQKTSRLLLGPE